MGDVTTSAPPIVRRASALTSKRPSVSTGKRESTGQPVGVAATTARRQSSMSYSRDERRKSTYPARDESRSATQHADEMAILDFPGPESIEDFSARIAQEQQIRFQSKRHLLKLMLDEADIDADMLLSQDLREKVNRPESEFGEENFRESPPPPPSPHPGAKLQKALSDLSLDASVSPPRHSKSRRSHSLIISEPDAAGGDLSPLSDTRRSTTSSGSSSGSSGSSSSNSSSSSSGSSSGSNGRP